jgi:hypothetical protein
VTHPNFSGIWLANLGRSRVGGLAPAKISIKIVHGEDALTQEIAITYQGGEQSRQTVSYAMTGIEFATELRGMPVRVRVFWKRGASA